MDGDRFLYASALIIERISSVLSFQFFPILKRLERINRYIMLNIKVILGSFLSNSWRIGKFFLSLSQNYYKK